MLRCYVSLAVLSNAMKSFAEPSSTAEGPTVNLGSRPNVLELDPPARRSTGGNKLEVLIPIAALVFAAVIISLTFRKEQRRADGQRDVQLALLEKFKSAEEMTHFLSTEQGVQFVDHLTAPSDRDPRQRTVGMVVGGSVMTSLALGFGALHLLGVGGNRILVPAVVFGALGVGLFVGGILSHSISKKLGLTKER
jgi:hypothetical protein